MKPKVINALDIIDFKNDREKIDFKATIISFDFMDQIQLLMDKHKMSRQALAKKMYIDTRVIDELFSGDRVLTLRMLAKIQDVFDVRFRIGC
jgi:ribosome-binding protein aMBF1 (putative translation factor)